MPHTLEKQFAAEGPAISPLAGKPAPKELLIDPARLQRDYYERKPDVTDPNQLVAFGTSGHRGSPFHGTFNEAHILAITQAICEYRKGQGIDGPLYMGKDTHAVSEPAQRTALEVLLANGVETIIQENGGVTPTPVISHAILVYNRGRKEYFADGIVITPSHNPPEDGGFKYNPPNGGPADTDVTGWVQNRANDLLRSGNKDVKRVPFERAIRATSTHQEDFVMPFVRDLMNVVDMDAIRNARLKLGVDPLGGASLPYWDPINSIYGLEVEVVNRKIDPDLLIYDRGSRRQNPHGLFESLCHGPAGRVERSIPAGFRERYRRGPARHCESNRGIDESQSLFSGSDPILAYAPATLAAGCYRGKDPRKQQHD